MPYVLDRSLTLPHDNEVIWRFMDVPRLVSLLTSHSLWFARLDQLGDDWEGAQVSDGYSERLLATHAKMLETARAFGAEDLVQQAYHTFRSSHERQRDDYAASCWYVDHHDSMLMWKVYARDQLAIRSTVDRLKRAFISNDSVYIGHVYYDPPPVGASNLLRMFSKRPAFRGENEVRALVQAPLPTSLNPSGGDRWAELAGSMGLSVGVSTHTLIESVVTSPLLPEWAHNSLVRLVECIDSSVMVRRSALTSLPPRLPSPA